MVHSKIKRIWSYLKINLFIIFPVVFIFIKKDANSELLMLLLNLMLTLSFRHLLDSLMSSWWHLDTMLMTV